MIFDKKLVLKKTHDVCVSGRPALTVVMIHGISSDSTNFTAALNYLEGTTSLKNVRFVTFDLLGWGQSKKSDKLNYDYKEQLEALHNSIEKLQSETPLILVGHSMGTLVATRYADTYKKAVKELVLLSPPIYTEEDLALPAFAEMIEVFKSRVEEGHRGMTATRSFQNSLQYIILDKRNYKVLAGLKTHAVLIWGEHDELIASKNIPTVLEANPKYLTSIQTPSGHSLTKDKYTKLVEILERALNA